MQSQVTTASEPAWLSRALRPITEVRPGEAITALLLTLNVFLLLTAYYVLKPVREALILKLPSGPEYKAYTSGVIAILLFALVPLYGMLVDRLPRIKLVVGVSLAFALQVLLFYAAMAVPSLKPKLGFVYFAWVGVFNVMLVAQFWAFANDLYDKEQGDRLFPMIAIGASVGGAAGSELAKWLVNQLGIPPMLLVAAGLLAVCALLFWLVERRESHRDKSADMPATAPAAAGETKKQGGFGLVMRYRYLLLLAAFSLLYNWVNSNSEYMLSKIIKDDVVASHPNLNDDQIGEQIGAAYADFFRYVNWLGLVLQMFVVSRVVKWLGLSKAFLFLPVIALMNASFVAFLPIIALIKGAKTAENATDYSLNNTLRQMLWLVTSPQMKYKAKQVVDTFCVRIGDVCSALTVYFAVSLGNLSVHRFAWISLALGGVWLLLALTIGRMYRKLEASGEKLGA